MRAGHWVSRILAAGALMSACGTAFGQSFTDTEPNNTKAAAQAAVFTTAGDGVLGTITGSSTSSSTTVTGLGSADYYRVKTPAAAPGIYRYQFAITATGTAGHLGSLRGLNQSATTGIGTTDSVAQSSATTTAIPRSNVFYAFGTEAEIYYRVTGVTATTGTYTAELTRSTVSPIVTSTPLKAGPITISTILQTTIDTEFMVYDSTFTPVATFKNDDEAVAGGGSGATTQSICTRSLGAGTYYIAISNDNTNNNEAAPTDDDTRTSIVADFPGVVFNSSTTTNVDLDLFINDGCNTVPVSVTKANAYDVQFVQFTVGSPDVPCATLSESSDLIPPGTIVDFFATVTPASGGANTITSVLADLRNFGGGAAVVMSNDGATNGDAAVDNIWTARLTIGTYQTFVLPWTATVTDAGARSTTNFSLLTLTPAPPPNDTCEVATTLSSLPQTYNYGINQATHEPDIGCNSSSATQAFNGIWFTYTPSSTCFLSVTEAGLGTGAQDVAIVIYDGTAGCASLGAEIFCSDPETGVGTALSAGTTYYILVSRWTTTASTGLTDFFNLTFNCLSLPAPANDDCATAQVISSLPFTPAAVSNAGATHDVDTSCNGTTSTGTTETRNGIWYTYTPASNCFADMSETTAQDVVISAFTGACGAQTEVFCTGTEANVGFSMQGGTQYYILVGRFSNTASAGANDQIAFAFNACNAPPAAPANDLCSGATTVSGGFPYSNMVSIAGATDEVQPPTCAVSGTGRNGIWYTYTPAVTVLAVFNETGSEDTNISVYTGSCGALGEIACFTGETSTANLVTMEGGTQYFILVAHATSASTVGSSFTFTMNTFPPPPNDDCSGALVVSMLPYSDTQNIYASQDEVVDVACNSTTATIARRGVWYSYTPVGDCRLALGETGSLDTTLSAFVGTCGSLTHVFCSDSETTGVGFNAQGGTTYYLLVSTWSDAPTITTTSAYTITVDCVGGLPAAPSNDSCAGAAVIASLPFNDSPVIGGAFDEPIDTTCAATGTTSNPIARFGVWYSYTPAEACFLDFTESSSLDVVISAYVGICNSLSEVFCTNTEANVGFSLNGGTTYYFLVSLNSSATVPSTAANYGIAIDCQPATPPPSNDTCASAEVIATIPYSDSTNVTSAGDDIDTSCNTAAAVVTRAGIWYSYTPSSDCSVILTETGAQDIIYGVFSGSCAGLTEIGCLTNDPGASFGATSGTTYYILVGRFADTTSPLHATYDFSLDCVAPATNDLCSGAKVISTLPFSETVPLGGLTDDVEHGSCGSASVPGTNAGIWYTYTPSAVCGISLNEASTASGNDAVWVVYTGGCGALSEVACSGSEAPEPISLNPGTQYYILVGGNSTTVPSGPWIISVTCIQPAPNDTCASALDMTPALTGSSHQYSDFQDTRTATPDGPAPQCEGFGATTLMYSIWYSFTAPSSGSLSYTVEFGYGGGITGNPITSIHATSGACAIGPGGGSSSPSTTEISCSSADPATLNVPIIAGQTYYILVGDAGTLTDDGCPITIDVTFTPDAPTTEFCCRGTTCASVTAGTCIGTVAGSSSQVLASCGAGNSSASCCFADFNHTGGVTIDDLFLYLNAYFTSSPYANVGGDTVAGPTIDDLFLYINAYFNGCQP